MNQYRTEQEEFWAGDFGNEYIGRNKGEAYRAAALAFFSRALRGSSGITSAIEYGPNVGINLEAVHSLLPDCDIWGVEINSTAAAQLETLGFVKVKNSSVFDFEPDRQWDLVISKGLLIHIDPDHLEEAYEKLYSSCSKYLCITEYYSPRPVEVSYRGHDRRLFKRDFAGEFLDRHTDFRLVDYGFWYHRDPVFPQDDLTWFLLERFESRKATAD